MSGNVENGNRREHDRLEKSFRVEVSRLAFPLGSQPSFRTNCVDISAGGLLVECPEPFDTGDKLQVRVYIASLNKFHSGFLKVFESDVGQYLQAIAEVARQEPWAGCWRLGLRFVDIHEDDWQALQKLIERELRG